MAHQDTPEAAGTPSTLSMEDAAALFEDDYDAPEPEQAGDAEDFEDEPEDGEAEEQADEDEQEQPAIDPPVSLNAEEKEVFAQLPLEAQQAWAASETRRNAQVQEATTKAKEAQRTAEAAAATADRQAEARYAEQLRTFAAAFAPQMPDPARYADIQTYQRDKAIYDHAKAQHDELMQQVAGIGVETDEQKAERIKARDAELMQIPEIANEATRDAYIKGAFEIAGLFGYDQADLAENMDARDIQALAQAAAWKASHDELARIKARTAERRRDKDTGRFKSLKPGAARMTDTRPNKAVEAFKANPSSMKAAAAVFENL